MKRKSLLLLLCLAIIKVYGYDICVNNSDNIPVYYNFANEQTELEVTYGPSKYMGDILIPEEVEYNNIKYKVTSIGEFAFSGCTSLITVTMPSSIKIIRRGAFKFSTLLSKADIPNSVTNIEEEAFQTCTSLTTVTIPKGVKGVNNDSFANCSSLKTVTIMGDLSYIGERAFGSCSSLHSIDFRGTVENIKFAAFYICEKLSSIILPEGLKSIGIKAFQYCGLSTLVLPNSLSQIDEGAFDCENITQIVSMIDNPFSIYGIDSSDRSFSYNTYLNAKLLVPLGSINNYRTTDGWKDFVHIEENEPSFINKPNKNNAKELKRYTLDGRIIKYESKGINIIQMDNGTYKKVFIK